MSTSTPTPLRRTRGFSILPLAPSPRLDSPVMTSTPTTNASTEAEPKPASYSPDGNTTSDTSSRTVTAQKDPMNDYLSELAKKEAHVVSLKQDLAQVQQELAQAQSDLESFKDKGRKLAALVGTPEDPEAPSVGRRVVDEIGSQFWSFVDDVKSATIGGFDEEYEGTTPGQGPILRKKSSISNFVRQMSPERRSLSPSRRQTRSPQRRSMDFSESPLRSHRNTLDLPPPTPPRPGRPL